jgi:hypothetical protein
MCHSRFGTIRFLASPIVSIDVCFVSSFSSITRVNAIIIYLIIDRIKLIVEIIVIAERVSKYLPIVFNDNVVLTVFNDKPKPNPYPPKPPTMLPHAN